MTMSFRLFDSALQVALKKIADEADRQGVNVYIVGGIVRDCLLKRKNLDLDIVVEGDGIAFAKSFAKKNNAGVTVYQPFRTATLLMTNGFTFDVATARTEIYTHPGALPVVRPAAIREDLFRRDFTINAIAAAVNRSRRGELIDQFGGLEDLKKKTIRILHPESFIDDPTRILRAVRFEQRFGFAIERETLARLHEAIETRAVTCVKMPRYFEEFKKILKESDVNGCLCRLSSLGGMAFVDEAFCFDRKLSTRLKGVKKTISLFDKKRLTSPSFQGWLVYLMAILSRLSIKKIERLLKECQMSTVDSHQIFMSALCQKILKSLSRSDLLPHGIYNILKPLGLETVAYVYSLSGQRFVRKRIENFLEKWQSACLTVSGNDLKRLGFKPGPQIGMALEEILRQKIDGKVKTRHNEIQLAKTLCS